MTQFSRPHRLLIYSSQALILIDLMDMLEPLGEIEVVTCTSTAQAMLALEAQPFATAIIDDSGDSAVNSKLQDLCSMVLARSIPLICLIASEDRRPLAGSGSAAHATSILKPVHESTLLDAAARFLAVSRRLKP